MMMKVILLAALSVTAVYAAIQPTNPTVCPTNGGRLQIQGAASPAAFPEFIPNVFTYTGNGQPLFSGVPLGPYLGGWTGCYFIPNATLSCSFTVYNDSALTLPIGTGTFSSSNMAIVQSGSTLYYGGDMQVVTTITSPIAGSAANTVNFRSGSFNIHFQAQLQHPDATDARGALANTIQYVTGDSGFITMWGSNGWNGSAYDAATRTTGLDLRLQFFCPNNPPIIVPCESCTDANSLFTISSSCIGSSPILRRSPSTCIQVAFSSSSSATCDS